MHVGLLACDEVADRFQHIAGGYQQMFERLLSLDEPTDVELVGGWIARFFATS